MIQNALNQALGTAGIAARLSPALEEKAKQHHEIQSGKKTIGALEEAEAQAMRLDQKQAASAYEQQRISKAQELFGKYPYAKEAKQFKKMLPMSWGEDEDDDIARQAEAMQKVENKQKAQKTQKRNFMEYLGKQPTSLGGTVSQLPPSLQQQIAKQYTSSQRKTMMDKMDKENENK